ncbi:alcohol dehydrogenase, iron-containing family [Synechococcus sp. PCC 7335]|uniref:bifunctional acetaldehyde-CoA/alcohol dehydrogenase n=1 Tax=Synechococcus sp. (strain ATCC 29403 / PCC 7335) TaxID=91464 RepID=UPI00017ECB41|nr:bifunctional acetaldehyde-CoA/alcohol dehydrogenase [Synechococcus sp. PCC 7335]EDX86913.1 alcohol dehydrogenase, iron-containing family [Synechococcus sp. PCC 7335]
MINPSTTQPSQIASSPASQAKVSQAKVNSLDALEMLISSVKAAQIEYASYSQEQVDHIFKMAALAANTARLPLAKQAVAETGMGVVEDKVIKNHFASEIIYNKYKHEKTCGIIESDPTFGIQKIAEPMGILAGIVPVTNPTSTAIFKTLIALKTRNAIILSPHPRARECTIAAARTVLEAAVKAGAPASIIGWIDQPSIELSQALMSHNAVSLVLATGGPSMVKAAYSSGHPSLGVGAGNTPALIDESADLRTAVSSILLSKTFDNGMICASEQSVVAESTVYESIKEEFLSRGAYFTTPEEQQRLADKILSNGRLNPEIVGQPVANLAKMVGIQVPKDTRVLIAEVEEIGPDEPLSYEKLTPILAMYRATDFDDGLDKVQKLVTFAGRGHTAVLYTKPDNTDHIQQFESLVETSRVLINTPASQGAIGDLYNFRLDPSLTLGCGSWGGNSLSANVEPRHLLNVKTVAERRENMLWFRVPPKIYFKSGSLPVALSELSDRERAFIVTDKPLYDLGMTNMVEETLGSIGIKSQIFYDVEPDPSLDTVQRGVAMMQQFQPDVIIAIGGGSPMDAAKIMWLMYEHPDIAFDGLAMRFMDIRKRVYELPPLGEKAILVAVPTTSGTGSEVTPFAVVTDRKTGIKYPLADYALTPTMAIVDPDLVSNLPKSLTAFGGVDALTHALEVYTSVMASEFTNGLALEAIQLIFKYLPRAYSNGANDPEAREKMHYASTIAGLAFANGFLGICHSMAHQLGATFHIPHGLANALMISHVIRYNATDAPFKQATFSQYKYPNAKWRYAQVADHLHLGGTTDDEKVNRLIGAIEQLKAQVDIPTSISAALTIPADEFYAQVDAIADHAFDDQCTLANPRYPLISDLQQLIVQAYRGDSPLVVGGFTERFQAIEEETESEAKTVV